MTIEDALDVARAERITRRGEQLPRLDEGTMVECRRAPSDALSDELRRTPDVCRGHVDGLPCKAPTRPGGEEERCGIRASRRAAAAHARTRTCPGVLRARRCARCARPSASSRPRPARPSAHGRASARAPRRVGCRLGSRRGAAVGRSSRWRADHRVPASRARWARRGATPVAARRRRPRMRRRLARASRSPPRRPRAHRTRRWRRRDDGCLRPRLVPMSRRRAMS